ncbi:unnamed protein product [Thelazia callipaeda]|uniref:PDZ and LIM domain protein Zasp n=1 Tax=Thelazia callipaeda TaxID=103827 RepID=A0A158RBJ0_THECL|nr:unnamed protein product [Thelazia callipaeda]
MIINKAIHGGYLDKMSQAEMVTVRMSRGHLGTPWGFEIGPKLTITNVMGGSLADRAGLLDNDILVELEGHQKLNIELARQLLSKTEHKIDLVVHRVGSDTTHQIWQPSVTENAEYNKFQHSVLNVPSVDAEKMHPSNVPLKVSLEHQNPDSIAIPGFNVTAQPFGDHQQVKHLQYNSPMSLYSPQSAAEQYLQQTGGLFGTDPNLTKQKEVPSYLRSETLRLIQESERSNEVAKTRSSVKPVEINREGSRLNAENITGLPVCFICGRNIIGPMCRASDCTMHGECFQCSTCGSALKNIGHHFINEKFYCDIHGQQQLRGGSITTKPDDIHSSLTRKSRITYNERNTLHAPYQPEIMTRQRLSISPTAWKTQSPISPSNRGVPPAATHYGHELTELKKEIHSSSVNSGLQVKDDKIYDHERKEITYGLLDYHFSKDSHTSDQHLNVLTRVRSLPSEIRKVTSPRRNPFRHQWSPESSKIKKYWQYDCMAAALDNGISNESEDIVLSLSEYIKENEREYRRRPSPKRYLLRESITRYQQELHDQEEELSHMLDNTIDFLKKLDKANFASKNSFIKPSNVHELIRQNDELPRDRAVLHNQRASIPYCEDCKQEIRGAYVLANGLSYCPNHFICSNKSCGRKLLDIGFVEEKGRKYCEHCFETEIAPRCAKCKQPITADCLNALQQQWHPHCFVCTHCHNAFGNSAFFLEQGQPYCEADWNALFTTKCVSCHYPIEAGDRWVEALGAAFHSNCFNCTSCNVNLEGENFYARNGAPYCKLHA